MMLTLCFNLFCCIFCLELLLILASPVEGILVSVLGSKLCSIIISLCPPGVAADRQNHGEVQPGRVSDGALLPLRALLRALRAKAVRRHSAFLGGEDRAALYRHW